MIRRDPPRHNNEIRLCLDNRFQRNTGKRINLCRYLRCLLGKKRRLGIRIQHIDRHQMIRCHQTGDNGIIRQIPRQNTLWLLRDIHRRPPGVDDRIARLLRSLLNGSCRRVAPSETQAQQKSCQTTKEFHPLSQPIIPHLNVSLRSEKKFTGNFPSFSAAKRLPHLPAAAFLANGRSKTIFHAHLKPTAWRGIPRFIGI